MAGDKERFQPVLSTPMLDAARFISAADPPSRRASSAPRIGRPRRHDVSLADKAFAALR
jgi:hypothetical protein